MLTMALSRTRNNQNNLASTRNGTNGSLKKLYLLLRNEGDKVLSGNSTFTLTTEVLNYLNAHCRKHSLTEPSSEGDAPETSHFLPFTQRLRGHQESRRQKEEWALEIQFIKDFMLSTPSLKVIHNSGTLTSSISLHQFGNIRRLHLRRIQIHMVEGLQKLRNSLVSLTVYRSIDKLKDVVECCGGDMSAPLTWPVLTFVSFTFNALTSLDDSLRLLPYLQKLDLSNNCLESCESHLENLADIQHVTLAYNYLKQVPSFSMGSRSSLVSLILRGNHLDMLTGLEVLVSLQDLDLGENYINDHSFLGPLGSLARLKQLQLDGNPIFYHRLHRPLTVSCLSQCAVSLQFVLDKRKLTSSEINYFGSHKKPTSYSVPSTDNRTKLTAARAVDRGIDYMSPSSGIGSETDNIEIIAQPVSSKKTKRKRLRPRKTEILDMDTSDLPSSQGVTPGTSPAASSFKDQMMARSEEARRTKREIEELREHYGPNWLQAIEDRNIFNQKKLTKSFSPVGSLGNETLNVEVPQNISDKPNELSNHQDETVANKGEQLPTDDDDLYLTETRPAEVNNPIMATIARLAAGQVLSETVEVGQFITGTNDTPQASSGCQNLGQADRKSPLSNTTIKQSDLIKTGHAPDQAMQGDFKPQLLSSHLAVTYPSERDSQLSNNEQRSSNVSPPLVKENIQDVNQSDMTRSDSIETLEQEEITEPIFANLHDDKMIILTLTPKLLVEKDIRMRVMEELELRSLSSMEVRDVKKVRSLAAQAGEDNLKSEAGEEIEVMELCLRFDYMKKDKQTRCYYVDKHDGNILVKHFRPVLEAKEAEAKAKSTIVMQCLKCNRTFLKSELVQQRKSLPASGSSKDLRSLQALIDKPTLICPKCASNIIIEIDPSLTAVKSNGSTTSTPVGSYSSTGSYMEQTKPLAKVKSKNLNSVKPPRKNSTSSLDITLTRKLHLYSTSTVGANSGSWTQDSLLTKPVASVGRDRSNAFNANTKMVRSTVMHGASFSEAEELVCVEDYFSDESKVSSQQMAAMTTSLRGDPSTKGRTADLRRNTLDNDLSKRSADTGLHSVASSFLGSSVGSNMTPQKLERELLRADDIAGSRGDEDVKSASKKSAYKNLAAMEDMVKSLVSEGHDLMDQESLSSSFGSKDRTVSISAFRKSSISQRWAGADSDSVTGLKLSESNSSITILPTPIMKAADRTSSVTSTQEPVKFSIGTPLEDQEVSTQGGVATNDARVMSPLNPDICNSMVYMTSVISAPAGNTDTLVDSMDNHNTTMANLTPTDNAQLDDEEDIASIYDRSWLSSLNKKEPKLLSGSISPEKRTSSAAYSPTDSATPVNYASLAGYEEDVDSETSNEYEDATPQYAFHHMNHHLTLYMMMSLFENDEEFKCKIQSEVVQYIVEEPYDGILVMSSCRFYILKITSDDHSLPPDQWLTCVEIQPIPELRYIDVGLGCQSFRLEFVTDCSSYTFITRNKEKTLQFVELLHTNLAKYAVSQGISSHVIVNEDVDQVTSANLDKDVICKADPNQKLLLYCMGYIERGNQKLFPVSFVITSSDICLVRTNHQWPQPRLQAPLNLETVGKQFTVLERQKISNVAAVEVCEVSMKKVRLELFNERDGVSMNWNITLSSRQTAVELINALSEPWAREFGVEMEIKYSELEF